MLENLEETDIFADLSSPQLEQVAAFCTRLVMHDGEVLIHENESRDFDLFILVQGAVEVVSNSTSVTSGEVVISRQDKNLFGEISWLTSRKRTATVRCHGDVEAIQINGEQLNRYMESDPMAGYHIMRRIAVLLADSLEDTSNLLKQILWNANI
jgi:CRP-like cAMP-binding protein